MANFCHVFDVAAPLFSILHLRVNQIQEKFSRQIVTLRKISWTLRHPISVCLSVPLHLAQGLFVTTRTFSALSFVTLLVPQGRFSILLPMGWLPPFSHMILMYTVIILGDRYRRRRHHGEWVEANRVSVCNERCSTISMGDFSLKFLMKISIIHSVEYGMLRANF